jgi:hypothetical protein
VTEEAVMPYGCPVWSGKNTAHIGTKLKLQPHKTTVLYNHLPSDYEVRIQCCRWFQEAEFGGFLDLELTFYSDEACFNLSGYVNSPNNIYWSRENPHE